MDRKTRRFGKWRRNVQGTSRSPKTKKKVSATYILRYVKADPDLEDIEGNINTI